MEDLSLIVGLGNPGKTYSQTRHNAGFMVVEVLAGRWGLPWRMENRFHSRLARGEVSGKRVLLCQPQTYMNASGQAVGAVTGYFQVHPARVLVVLDDADLPLGEIRLRPEGGTGGHHGLESVQAHLGTKAYPRLRVGIGRRAPAEREITGHVLGSFSAEERSRIERVLAAAADQAACWLEHGIARAMNEFNGVVDSSNDSNE